jgi:hypothetical protein
MGLGDRPDTFDSIVVRRFPGAQRSDEVTVWQEGDSRPADIPDTPAFTDLLSHHDQCGVTELAGKAVGAAFVGVTGACLAIAEATRELHGGTGTDTRVLSLASMTGRFAAASQRARLVSAPLQPQYGCCGLLPSGRSRLAKAAGVQVAEPDQAGLASAAGEMVSKTWCASAAASPWLPGAGRGAGMDRGGRMVSEYDGRAVDRTP